MESLLPSKKLDTIVLSDTDIALRNEWLVTNGLGGYASSTVLGLNTRKYHGLLVAAFNPPVNRHVLLARLDEQILTRHQLYSLAANENTEGMQRDGLNFLSGFSASPFPSYTYGVENKFQLRKTVLMPHEKNVSVIIYDAFNASEGGVSISIAPLLNLRSFHSVTEKDGIKWSITRKSARQLAVSADGGMPAMILCVTDGQYVAEQGKWVESLYRVEAERGESSLDYNYSPGHFEFDVRPDETKSVLLLAAAGKNENEAENTLSSISKNPDGILGILGEEVKRKAALIADFEKYRAEAEVQDWLRWLVLATDTFIVNRESTRTKSIIAGYHWFNDWGRDSLISMPGLTLVTGRFNDAKQILLTFQQYCQNGVVPNAFPDMAEGKPAYNTVDATLWYFNAVFQYLKYTGDFRFVQEKLWPTLQSIIDYHLGGTVFGIHVDQDGLLAHGPQLTWMDAAPDGKPVTPRAGKAVEIQALWYNALKIMQLLAKHYGQAEKAESYCLMADSARVSFLEEFWNSGDGFLFDVVVDKVNRDGSLRPNQILAVSLGFTMIDKTITERVVATVWKELLTPYGLKTLEGSDPLYVGKYHGNRWQRDNAYHNGSVWPWLLGPFVTAFLKMKNHEEEWRSFAFENFLKPLFTEGLSRACLGSISEIFDGDSPHEPNGCIAQAWSVAEPLRAYVEDVLLKRPPCERQVLAV